MKSEIVDLSLVRKSCGPDPLQVAVSELGSDDSAATCVECGAQLGRFGNVKVLGLEALKVAVEKNGIEAFLGFKL